MDKKVKEIVGCEKCDLYKNQKPLLDKEIKCDVMWVGLSAKRVADIKLNYPLENNTISGKLIEEIENRRTNLKFYKTNLVKCLPLDKCNKLRYPHKDEMCCCIENLLVEIDSLKPKLIFLLGNIVSDFVTKYVNENSYKGNIKFIKIEHPSYISIYKKKQKEKYIEKVLKHIDKDI